MENLRTFEEFKFRNLFNKKEKEKEWLVPFNIKDNNVFYKIESSENYQDDFDRFRIGEDIDITFSLNTTNPATGQEYEDDMIVRYNKQTDTFEIIKFVRDGRITIAKPKLTPIGENIMRKYLKTEGKI